MSYSSILTTEVDSDSPLNVNLFSKIKSNFDALHSPTGGDLGYVGQGHLANNSVGQGELKQLTQVVDYSSSINSNVTVWNYTVCTAPLFTIGLSFYGSSTSGADTSINSHYENVDTLSRRYSDDSNFTVDQRRHVSFRDNDAASTHTIGVFTDISYINSSPPYDLGDGEIPLFAYILLDSNNKIVGYTSAIDPPWAYNGPTNVKPNHVENGKKFIKGKRLKEDGNIETYKEELTQEIKNADMDLIPHPFFVKPGETVILLDAADSLELRELTESRERVSELFFKEYLRLDNSPIERGGPNGLPQLKYKWKNSRSRAGEMIKDKREKKGPFAS